MKTYRDGEQQPVLLTDEHGRRYLDHGGTIRLAEPGEHETDVDLIATTEDGYPDLHTSACRNADATRLCNMITDWAGVTCADLHTNGITPGTAR